MFTFCSQAYRNLLCTQPRLVLNSWPSSSFTLSSAGIPGVRQCGQLKVTHFSSPSPGVLGIEFKKDQYSRQMLYHCVTLL